MLPLECQAGDDPLFVECARRVIAGAVVASGLRHLIVVQIDHWFGPRWLGFCGTLYGAGVHSRCVTEPQTRPPFHPHRVVAEREYEYVGPRQFELRCDRPSIHGLRPSRRNIGYRLRGSFGTGRLYAWYSGDTAQTDKGAVMLYRVARVGSTAWYAGFDRSPQWHLATTRAIAPHRIGEFMKLGGDDEVA